MFSPEFRRIYFCLILGDFRLNYYYSGEFRLNLGDSPEFRSKKFIKKIYRFFKKNQSHYPAPPFFAVRVTLRD